MKSTFREWTLDKIDAAFQTKSVRHLDSLTKWLAFDYQLNDIEQNALRKLSEKYLYLGGEDWNEAELDSKIISPLFSMSEIDNEAFSYFAQRELQLTIGDYELSGKVDGMIATGFRNPRKPYFCMSEYKRATDPDGDPKGQALIAMLTAQQLNENGKPILGCYVVGKLWHFMVLQGKEYSFSAGYTCDNDDIFEIYRILRGLRVQIETFLA